MARTHGLTSTYYSYGCRCRKCTEAMRVYYSDYTRRRRLEKFKNRRKGIFWCLICDLPFETELGRNIHEGRVHKD